MKRKHTDAFYIKRIGVELFEHYMVNDCGNVDESSYKEVKKVMRGYVLLYRKLDYYRCGVMIGSINTGMFDTLIRKPSNIWNSAPVECSLNTQNIGKFIAKINGEKFYVQFRTYDD